MRSKSLNKLFVLPVLAALVGCETGTTELPKEATVAPPPPAVGPNAKPQVKKDVETTNPAATKAVVD